MSAVKTMCKVCECEMDSRTATICIPCMRMHTKICPECRGVSGKLLSKYIKHKGPVTPGKACHRCGKVHPDETIQLTCPKCNNERVVLELPVKAPQCLDL